ncbi:Uma2 family endonuclease [Leptothoe sp. PORK10 BA2]|uniref:Uma2 family endonuclease n=1 Tax=Leptothoe sp. PORK10 BA2 TaxID=3110254 RepID=UPI002B1F35DC|nr:Uma2 family endonuclease [Leptothoe sp. PORK10 BA2]MEA5464368.1 Uma2 family endonuclease [Leptothoe sp. PORK10 BA2]
MVLYFDPKQCLPSAAELPDSDDTPVDNELQNLIPNLLDAILALVWSQRRDWFFGVDMGIYSHPQEPPLVPDGFLSLGVDRFVGEEGRLSYVLWEEENIVPTLALEVVSKTYGGEYDRKKERYADLGIRYYVVYLPNPQFRRKRTPLEIYQLVDGGYQRLEDSLEGNPIWLPEIGLGLGRERGLYLGRDREWLYWYDQAGNRLLTPEEQAQQERTRADQAQARADQAQARADQEQIRAEQERLRADQEQAKAIQLAEKLRELGIDPDAL